MNLRKGEKERGGRFTREKTMLARVEEVEKGESGSSFFDHIAQGDAVILLAFETWGGELSLWHRDPSSGKGGERYELGGDKEGRRLASGAGLLVRGRVAKATRSEWKRVSP